MVCTARRIACLSFSALTVCTAVATRPALAASDSTTEENAGATTPRLDVSVDVSQADGPWVLKVTNHGTQAVRILADTRLLTLVVRAPNKNFAECTLPASMRGTDRSRWLVLKPKQRYTESFDPRFFCLGPAWDDLSAGGSVTALLGWKSDPNRTKRGKPQVAPFVVEPADAEAEFVPIKRLASTTAWLEKRKPATEEPSKPERPSDADVASERPMLSLRTARWSDATVVRDAHLTTTIKNTGGKSFYVHLRPDNITFAVKRPDGAATTCGNSDVARAVARDFFERISTGQTQAYQVLLGEVCPPGTFDSPGVYTVTPTLQLVDAGSSFGLSAITGTFPSTHATLLRIQTSRQPYHSSPPLAQPLP